MSCNQLRAPLIHARTCCWLRRVLGGEISQSRLDEHGERKAVENFRLWCLGREADSSLLAESG
jgi:hypothetical protein